MRKEQSLQTSSRMAPMWLQLLMWSIVLIFLLPFYVLIVYAFKPREATMLSNPLSFPTELYLDNFFQAIQKSNFYRAFSNSFVSTVFGVALLVFICAMAAYIIVRKQKNKFYAMWQYVFLAAIMLPFQTVMFPIYKNLVSLGMLNTLYAYVIVSVGFQMGFDIFLYCGFVKTVPIELEEAAAIDGCGRMYGFWRIVFPLLTPATMTVIVLSVLGIWNDYQIALVVISKAKVATLPLVQQSFIGQQISYLNLAAAACLMSIIPVFIMFLILQKYIVKGVTAGAVKG